jgi:hypothetical protein
MPRALNKAYSFDAYEASKDGGDAPIGGCPRCNAEAFHVESDRCLVCGEGRVYDECERRGSALNLDEQTEGGLCGYCAHVADKYADD